MTFSTWSFFSKILFSMWEENIKFKTFRMLYFKEIIVLEEVIEARYASYRNELHEFARKPVCYSSGCEYSKSATWKLSLNGPTVVLVSVVGAGKLGWVSDTLTRMELTSKLKLRYTIELRTVITAETLGHFFFIKSIWQELKDHLLNQSELLELGNQFNIVTKNTKTLLIMIS